MEGSNAVSGLGGRVGDALHLSAQRGKRIAVIVTAVLLAASGATGLVFGGSAVAELLGGSGAEAVRTAPPPEPVLPQPALRPAAVDGPVPTVAGVTATLDPVLAEGG
ncbi:MAG: hypothetical protein ACRDSN_07690, partial [Pseudonocardiaceae bacterium]